MIEFILIIGVLTMVAGFKSVVDLLANIRSELIRANNLIVRARDDS